MSQYQMSQHQRIIVKVGTNVLTRPDGSLDMTNISHLTDQIAALRKAGKEIVLVSSGAVGAGRSIFLATQNLNKVVQRQVCSAIGQVRLMEIYRQFFASHDLFCAQVLATKEDFRDRQHYLNMQNCLFALLRSTVVPILNENDVVSIDELMFTDNDELAGLLAAMINADALILLSSVDGVLDGHPDDPGSRVIPEIEADDEAVLKHIAPARSSFGRGGMNTKLRMAQKAARLGTTTYIANGRRANILEHILQGDFTGTCFPAKNAVSNVKKWLAHHEDEYKGTVVVNAGAEAALRSKEQISSLLPVGVTAVHGEFEKGDLIRIVNEKEEAIGLGLAQYSAKEAQDYLGEQGQKPLVHYDYLYVERF